MDGARLIIILLLLEVESGEASDANDSKSYNHKTIVNLKTNNPEMLKILYFAKVSSRNIFLIFQSHP